MLFDFELVELNVRLSFYLGTHLQVRNQSIHQMHRMEICSLNKIIVNFEFCIHTSVIRETFLISANIYEALYTYEATDPSDLTFDIGELILVRKSEGDWWTGRIANRIGTFPNNYVQKYDFTNVRNITE